MLGTEANFIQSTRIGRSDLMEKTRSRHYFAYLAIGLVLMVGALNASAHSAGAASPQAAQQDKPVEQTSKNIQVLTGMASSQLLPVMHFMRTSLGVRCDYCHLAENDKYWMDDKPAKQTARKMLQMVFDINKANFGGRQVVTCNTCHRGSVKPVAVPMIGQGAYTNTTADLDPKPVAPLPPAEQILDRYLQALGGRVAVDKIKTRVTKVTLLRIKIVNSGTPKAAALNRGDSWTIETFQKTPNKYLSIITTADGVIYQGFNGTVGWTKNPSGQREMNPAELARIKRQADLYGDLKLKERYSKMDVTGREKIGDNEVYVVEARSLDNRSEKLFFDVKTGFLIRRIVFNEIKLGLIRNRPILKTTGPSMECGSLLSCGRRIWTTIILERRER